MAQDYDRTRSGPPATRWSMSAGKIIALIVGSIIGLVAIVLLIGGIALAAVYVTQRDDDGFVTTPDYDVQTDAYALVSDDVDLGSRPSDWWPSDPATVRFSVDPVTETPVFVGIGPASDVDEYMQGVAHHEVTSLGDVRTDVTYESIDGDAPAGPPGEQTFWIAETEGSDEQVLEWDIDPGEWKVVMMNADGSSILRANVEAGVKIDFLLPIIIGLIVAGLLLGALAIGLWIFALTGNRKPVMDERASISP